MRTKLIVKASCHFTNPRPNWDAYDSWANMLPFNRDRIYKGSQEEEAFIRLLEHLQDHPIISQLLEEKHLPIGVTRDNGLITITPDGCDGTREVPNDPKSRCIAPPDKTVSFIEQNGLPKYTGFDPATNSDCKQVTDVMQGGDFLTLHHSEEPPPSDEGRGVELFDNFTGFNARRVAQELLDHPRNPVDVRPIALAIAKNCDFVLKKASSVERFKNLLQETEVQRHSLPQTKANLQAENLFGLITENNEGPGPMDPGPVAPTPENITREVARRSLERFRLDTRTGFMIDREDDQPLPPDTRMNHSPIIALFRFFLEEPPLVGVQLGRWSMGVLGRSATYTFADLFPLYIRQIKEKLTQSLGDKECPELETMSKPAIDAVIPPPSVTALARETTGISQGEVQSQIFSPQGPDLVIETIGCDAGTGLEFKTSNVGNESADDFRTEIVFISRATRQQVDHPTVPRPEEQPLLLGPGEWTDLSVAVPKACFPEDLPFEQQGCDVLIFADSEGAVNEPNEENMDRGLCAP